MSNRQHTIKAAFNKQGGIVALYHSNKWNSVAELRCHSMQEIMTSLTTARAPKIILTYDCNIRPTEESQEDVRDGGSEQHDTCHDVQIPSTCYHCLRYARSEEMREWRRKVGDNGGIKFQGKIAKTRDDGCTNTITNVFKDNLILESYGIQRD